MTKPNKEKKIKVSMTDIEIKIGKGYLVLKPVGGNWISHIQYVIFIMIIAFFLTKL